MYERIRELCKLNGTTITALERDLGFAKGSICKMENHKPSSDRLKKIADRFNVTIEYILGGNDYQYDSDSHTWEAKDYYESEDAKEMAQFLFENPEHKVLFDACRKVKAEDMAKALKAIGIFIDEE